MLLANLESYNAMLIEQGLPQADRLVLLNKMAKKQLETLVNAKIAHDKVLGLTKKGDKK